MNRPISISDTDEVHLERLQAMAKIASVCHRDRIKFKRNRNLSHVVHASLNIAQAIVALMILIFHHIHHYVNRQHQKDDPSIPTIPEEWNPIFGIYFLCIIVSLVFAGFWLKTKYFEKEPRIVVVGCFVLAALVLIVGIMEMKHADWYLNLEMITDSELLVHPIFIHNFIMCLISILCMCLYLLEGWILLDYCIMTTRDDGSEVSDLPFDSGEVARREELTRARESPGDLDPIPDLEKFPSVEISEEIPAEKEPVILYCCLVDLWDYIKFRREMQKPLDEFQVIHVM